MKKILLVLTLVLATLVSFVACSSEPKEPVEVVTPAKVTKADVYTAGGYFYVKFDAPIEVNRVQVAYTQKDKAMTVEELKDAFLEPIIELASNTDLLTGTNLVSATDAIEKLLDEYHVAEYVADNIVMTDYSLAKYQYVRSNDILESVFSLLGNNLFTLVAADDTNTSFRIALALPQGVQNFVDALLAVAGDVLDSDLLSELLPINLSSIGGTLNNFEGGLPIPPIYMTTDIIGLVGDVENILNVLIGEEDAKYSKGSLLTKFIAYDADGSVLGAKDFGRIDLSTLEFELDKSAEKLVVSGLNEDYQYLIINTFVPFEMKTVSGVDSVSMKVDVDEGHGDEGMLIIIAKDPSNSLMSSICIYEEDFTSSKEKESEEREAKKAAVSEALKALKPEFAKVYYKDNGVDEYWNLDFITGTDVKDATAKTKEAFNGKIPVTGISIVEVSVKDRLDSTNIESIGYGINGLTSATCLPCASEEHVPVTSADDAVLGWGIDFTDLIKEVGRAGYIRAHLYLVGTSASGKYVTSLNPTEDYACYNAANKQPAFKLFNETGLVGGKMTMTGGTYYVDVEADVYENGTFVETLKRYFLVSLDMFANAE